MSYANTIANAVVSVIQGIATPPVQTTFRKNDSLTLSDKAIAANVVCVVTVSDEEQLVDQTFGNGSTDFGTVVRAYMIGITLYKLHGGNIQTSNDTIPAMCLAIEQALNKPTLSGASTVCDTTLVPFKPIDPKGFGEGYECARCYVVFMSAENRNS
jgi:hypothetical protein